MCTVLSRPDNRHGDGVSRRRKVGPQMEPCGLSSVAGEGSETEIRMKGGISRERMDQVWELSKMIGIEMFQ
jgi:hypothetical protein